jgi:hypothetical protein
VQPFSVCLFPSIITLRWTDFAANKAAAKYVAIAANKVFNF